ncbi:MAG: pirin family protein [Candidatus Binatia bacterium]
MFTIRPAAERGLTQLDWLDSWHTFSFGDYYDPAHMGFGALRVINEDVIAPGGGFGMHGHRDIETITYVLEGAIEHRDSLGNASVIRPGDVQRMTAGSGIVHSELNASQIAPAHALQFWIMPDRRGLAPGYEQRALPAELGAGLRLIASQDGREGSVTLHQSVALYAARLGDGEQVTCPVAAGRRAWLHVARGELQLGQHRLSGGDAAGAPGPTTLELRGNRAAEVLLFDLAA